MNRAQPLAPALLTHTRLKFNVSGTSLYLTTRGAGAGGGGDEGQRGNDLQKYSPAARPAGCGTAHPEGEGTTKAKGRKHARYTQFPVVSPPLFPSACLGTRLFAPLKSHQIHSGQLCMQTSFQHCKQFGGTADFQKDESDVVTSPSFFFRFLL